MFARGHGWRHGLEMAVARLAPVAAIVVLGELAASAYLAWFMTGLYPVMSLGMLVQMLYRRDHFTGWTAHAAHAARVGS